MDKKNPLEKIFYDDDLDEAVRAADDTGLVEAEQEIAEEEPLIEEERHKQTRSQSQRRPQ